MKDKTNFDFDTFITSFLAYLFIFYLAYLFMDKFGLLPLQIFVNAVVASIFTTFVLHKSYKKQDHE